ncbi:hypothetical protein ILYODFUR_023343, partial [Ilyodon furcidens]
MFPTCSYTILVSLFELYHQWHWVWSSVAIDHGWATPVLMGRCPATFRCVLAPTHLNEMAELPPQYEVKFCTGLAMSQAFDSGVEAETHVKVAGHRPSRTRV